jgi:eukaryotic-like serine/threonine-protein kinase
MPASSTLLDDRYLLTERIGVGGFSEVWRAQDRALDRPVAVKLLHSGFAGHEETLQRFRAEARHAGALSHQNIARVYDYGDPSAEHPPYLVMELIDGDSLAQVLRTSGAMDAARAMDIVAQTAAGLQAAHQAGLVHRDVKPANLLLSDAGVVKITDFGISYAAGSAPMTRTGMIVGTPSYLAPERTSGALATQASDIYSLGVVAYECLTGAPPFAGTAIEVAVAHRDRALPPLPASVQAAVAGFVADLTLKDPAVRPASAAEVAASAARLRDQLRAGHQALTARLAPPPHTAASYHQTPAPTEELAQPPARRRRGARMAFGVASAAVVAALIALAGANLLGATSAQHGSGSPAASPVTSTTVEVNGQAFIGLPVSVAVRELKRLHLLVRVRSVKTDAQPRGRVVAIDPTGRVPVGSLVTVVGARRGHGHDHGEGHDHGNGNGDGGQGN